MANLERFITVYRRHLRQAVLNAPETYSWHVDQLDDVMARMGPSIARGSFNKDSIAFKHTCRELGIPHTYKAIRSYVTC